MADEHSTTSEIPDSPARTGRWAAHIGMLLLAAIVVAGLFGVFGLRTDTVEASASGYRLEVEHASLTRAGQPSPLHIRLEHTGGFDGPVQLSLCDDYFDHLDFQSWYPTPSAETGTSGTLDYEFDPPSGEVLEVSLDARTAPGQFGGKETCEVTVLVEDVPLTSVTFSTWRLP